MLIGTSFRRCSLLARCLRQFGEANIQTSAASFQKQSSAPKASDGDEIKESQQQKKMPPWSDPYKHALPEQTSTYSDYREADVNWEYVRRLLPRKLIPEAPQHGGSVTPSGWRAPKEKAADLPYYIKRGPNHMPTIYLERRRDELNPKTMDFEYVELVNLKGIEGDLFACERDLRAYLEKILDHPVGTHVDELKGKIRIKGADRTLVEQFVYDCEEEFKLL